MVSRLTRLKAFANEAKAAALPTLFGNLGQNQVSKASRAPVKRGRGVGFGKRVISLGGVGGISLGRGEGGGEGTVTFVTSQASLSVTVTLFVTLCDA